MHFSAALMNQGSFFAELKRRNVYKVAVAYAVIGWLLIQIATQTFPFLEIPNWAIRLVIMLIAIGFPIALILAWAFELTPQGLKRTAAADDTPTGRCINHAWIYVVLVAAALAIGLFFLGRRTATTKQNPSTAISQKSVAVLPFENLSDDKANAYFSDGIQEEILTRLAKIADLKVISRMSTQQYQSKPGNLSEIAKQLGVANILEGSVQKAGDQVRVNVQLINAQADSHVWADTYDRKLTDIFGVESEIAKSIAQSLQAKLTGREEQALATKPTNNPEAYEAYLRGISFEARSATEIKPLEQAIGFYEQALQLDSNFAVAWARLSRANAFFYFRGGEMLGARRDAAKRALEKAQKLQPDSPETLLALGFYQYWVLRDYEVAKTTFIRVAEILPGSSEIPYALGGIARQQGHWNESVAYREEALALDPRNVFLLDDTAWTYIMLRQFPAALTLYDRALDIVPNDPVLMGSKACIYQAEGDVEQAAKLLLEINAQTTSSSAFDSKIRQLMLERNLDEPVRLLQARLAQFHFGSESEKAFTQNSLAFAQRLAGDPAAARISAEQAYNTLKPLYINEPENAALVALLSETYAILGNKDAALKEAERAITLLPSSEDAVAGPDFEENLALIEMIVGENSRAISTFARLLRTPYGGLLYAAPVTPALLRLDPTWDPLRADHTFQKLCEKNPTEYSQFFRRTEATQRLQGFRRHMV